jgi:hypothetical protein
VIRPGGRRSKVRFVNNKKRLAGQSASLPGGGDCESSLENPESVRTRRLPPRSGDAFKQFHTDDTFWGSDRLPKSRLVAIPCSRPRARRAGSSGRCSVTDKLAIGPSASGGRRPDHKQPECPRPYHTTFSSGTGNNATKMEGIFAGLLASTECHLRDRFCVLSLHGCK